MKSSASASQHKHARNNGGWGGGGTAKKTVATAVMGVVCVIGAGYVIVGQPLYWLLTDAFSHCPPCICRCPLQPLLSLPIGCMEHHPGVGEKNLTKTRQLVKELEAREGEIQGIQQKADQKLLETKKLTSQYQKEAEKCTSGMETCEEAREKAEAALEAQRGVSSMWELRARHQGWKDKIFDN
ncbi:hypothetical protein DM860_012989 [Cuscuta australis]|uniref:Uncharacterized protein n=2 Tax=Cuscuta sect. Cleistogrammica TaxID=1824901 RepID=A0A328DW75_9ASTE|nr:hypothetical protein DM860_012989 [Cuscuta australis]